MEEMPTSRQVGGRTTLAGLILPHLFFPGCRGGVDGRSPGPRKIRLDLAARGGNEYYSGCERMTGCSDFAENARPAAAANRFAARNQLPPSRLPFSRSAP